MSLLNDTFAKIQKDYDLTDSSVKVLKRNIEKLNNLKPIENFGFLKDVKEIFTKLAGYKLNTQQSFMNSIVKVLKATEGESDAYKFWVSEYNNVVKKLQSKPADEKTDREETNWIDWKDVLAKQKELEDKAYATNEWNDILNAFVLGLYAYFEPRRNQDYLDMVIIRRKPTKRLLRELDLTQNYYLIKSNQFIFNKFKTSKSFGQQVFDIPEPIQKLFALYFEHYPARKGTKTPLLVKADGSAITFVNGITRILNNIFQKNIGATMLRHSYLTHTLGSDYKNRELVANKMGHSIGTQHKYVRKE